MAVKWSQSASRVLATLEKVAECQPVGISELARLLNADKSAVQRALTTLAREDWIRAAPGKPTRWEVTARIQAVAHAAMGSHDLRHRARAVLQALRDRTGESVLLNAPERGRFVVIDVLESRQSLRIVPEVGTIVPASGSATGRAILPYMSRERQIEFLGSAPDAAQLEEFAATAARGYAISVGEVVAGSTNFAAPIFEVDRQAVGAVLLSAPSDRVLARDFPKLGRMVVETARQLSRGAAPRVSLGSAPPTGSARPRRATG
jgi:IclR family acetate operon transcriptional repressor